MIGMGEEEEKQMCYNSRFGSLGTIGGVSGRLSSPSSSSQCSKKLRPKPRRIPQRGLGVAQLEKIRLEEQQRNDAAAAIFSSHSPLPPTTTTATNSSYFSLPVPGFRRMNRSSSSMFGPPLPVFNMAAKDSFTVPLVDQGSIGGYETGLSAVSILEQGNALRRQDFQLEKGNYRVSPGLSFRSSFDFPHEVSPAWPSPELMQRAQQNHSPSPMVNVSSTTSLSSGLNVQIEPPSNQSYCYTNYSTIWADKEEKRLDSPRYALSEVSGLKPPRYALMDPGLGRGAGAIRYMMVGMKRPSLFNPNNPTEPKFNYNHSAFAAPNRFDDSTPQGRGNALRFREVRTPSLGISAPSSLENKKEDECNGNFLTLAPRPTCWTSCPSSNNAKRPPTYPPQQNRKHSESQHRPVQGGTKPAKSTRKQTFYSFLPPAEARASKQTMTYQSMFKGGVAERVDLDLKL